MTNLTSEQIQAILDGAPEGATHCTDTVPSMNLYAKVEHLGGFYVSLSNRWESYPIYAGIHLLSDLGEILTLRQEVERLKVEVESKNHDIIEAVKKARTQWAREDVAAIKKRESEAAARAVEKAIVDAVAQFGKPNTTASSVMIWAKEYANTRYPSGKDGE